MKVLLVNPACLDQRVTDNDALVVPIGLYYLAAQLLDQGIEARILNLAAPTGSGNRPGSHGQGKAEDPDDTVRRFEAVLIREKPDLVGFSVTNPSRFCAMACAARAKTLTPGVWVVFGGPAPTFMAAHLFEACPALDVAVRGEGEIAFPALVRALEGSGAPDLSAIPGLVFRTEKSVKETGLPELLQDLDTLAHPSRFFTFQHLAMSRGCPGRCTFCGSPKFWGKGQVRRHSVAWFFKEIQTLAQNGVTHFFISDDTLTCDRDAVMQLCQAILDNGLAITWNAISRVDYVDRELLVAMRRAGCIQISFGVESGALSIRKTLGKPLDEAACIRAFDLCRSCGILPRAYFIYGSPGETQETIAQSIELMKKLKPLGAVFYMLVLFPGTLLYDQARTRGLVTDALWFEPIEDLPWFHLDPNLDFKTVQGFGQALRQAFFESLDQFALSLPPVAEPGLAPYYSDFLSRLAYTFSQGDYARDPRIKNFETVAQTLFEKALELAPDPRAYLGLAMMRQRQQRLAQAQDLLAQGLARFPGNRDLAIGMGVCCMNQGDFARALKCFAPFDRDPGLRHYIDICNTKLRGIQP